MKLLKNAHNKIPRVVAGAELYGPLIGVALFWLGSVGFLCFQYLRFVILKQKRTPWSYLLGTSLATLALAIMLGSRAGYDSSGTLGIIAGFFILLCFSALLAADFFCCLSLISLRPPEKLVPNPAGHIDSMTIWPPLPKSEEVQTIEKSPVRVSQHGLFLMTDGLRKFGQQELKVWVGNEDLLDEGRRYLAFNIDYLTKSKMKLLPDQTISYGYWHAQYREGPNGYLEAYELDENWDAYRFGISRTLRYFQDQFALCKREKADMDPPHSHSFAMVSLDVLEGAAFEAVRYPKSELGSGWWFVNDSYNGDVKSLRAFHLYHLTAARPEMAKLMGLPSGYRFRLDGAEHVIGFDSEVAKGYGEGVG